jgi:hypothetical protein
VISWVISRKGETKMNNSLSSTKVDPWIVLDYEIQMFFETRKIMSNTKENFIVSPFTRNAVVESMILHTRIVIDILLSKIIDPADIKLSDLFTDSKMIEQTEEFNLLRSTYGNSRKKGSVCWQFNKFLFHPTQYRTSSYDYAGALNTIDPPLHNALIIIAKKTNREVLMRYLWKDD